VSVAALVALASALRDRCNRTATSPEYHKTRTGAGIGAAGRGGDSALPHTRVTKFQKRADRSRDRRKSPGGAIGNYQDRQEQQFAAREHGGIGRPGSSVRATTSHWPCPGNITFRHQQCRRERGFLPDSSTKVSTTLVQVRPDHGRGGRATRNSTGSAALTIRPCRSAAQSRVAAYLTSRGPAGRNVSWSLGRRGEPPDCLE